MFFSSRCGQEKNGKDTQYLLYAIFPPDASFPDRFPAFCPEFSQPSAVTRIHKNFKTAYTVSDKMCYNEVIKEYRISQS
jgi:hypothetical protein